MEKSRGQFEDPALKAEGLNSAELDFFNVIIYRSHTLYYYVQE